MERRQSDVRDFVCSRDSAPWSGQMHAPAKIGSAQAHHHRRRVWRCLPVTWPKADLQKIPDHWRFAGSRQSPLSGGPRLAVTEEVVVTQIAEGVRHPCVERNPGLDELAEPVDAR
jgi:hypothetical protein